MTKGGRAVTTRKRCAMTEEFVLETRNLTKSYKKSTVLENADVRLKRGEIYGFIGENGAGKTTFMRIVAGLSYPTSGDIYLFGQTGDRELRSQRRRLGCMIESPALYGGMSARENLEVQRIQRGIENANCIEETLELVGLANTGSKRARDFSLGMRQRLGIAMALLGEAELLILDEPVNGLDPSGVAEVRGLMRRLNRERGVTLLVSSHILSELYQTATRYILLHKGRILEELTSEELDARCKKCVAIVSEQPTETIRVLKSTFGVVDARIEPDGTVLLYDHLDILGDISRALSAGGVVVTEMTPKGETLEDYFLRSIGGK